MPTAETALSRMRQALRAARAQRAGAVKLIHGYGSTGRGGVIRSQARRELAAMERDGKVAGFVPGEEFSPFSAAARRAVERCPELARDRDYTRCNPGVTVVLL